MNRQRAYKSLAPAVVVPLAFLWHLLGVWTFFPIGGGDFHWIFQRAFGGSAGAAYVVAAVYAIVAGALALFLLATTRKVGAWIVVALLLAGTVLNALLVGRESIAWAAFGTLATGVPLFLVAALLWRVRVLLPSFLPAVIAAIPGTWSIWEVYSFPYRNSAAVRRSILPLLLLYPFPSVAAPEKRVVKKTILLQARGVLATGDLRSRDSASWQCRRSAQRRWRRSAMRFRDVRLRRART